MIIIPLYVIFFIYLIYLFIISIFYFTNLSHLFRNGALTTASFLMTLLISVLVVTTLYFTVILLNGMDWQQPLTLWDGAWFSNLLTTSNF